MKMNFNMPVNLKFGAGVIKENSEDFKLGKRALLVTGQNSARLSGALIDVIGVLDSLGISHDIFDKVENNPSLKNISEGSRFGKSCGSDFIIAIGGGSPLDAAKAIAALATNDMDPIDLFKNEFKNEFLPIIAVPTTSGTGSEVTPYSVLTVHSMKTKRSFTSRWSYPKVAFADPCYTYSLPYSVSVDTAYDAFSHLLESYYSVRSNPLNDSIAVEGMKKIAGCMKDIAAGNLNDEVRGKLMYSSCLGGMTIAHTGTTLIHAMGYSLTFFKSFSHGRANAMIMAEYMRLNKSELPEKTKVVLDVLGLGDIDDADDYFSLGLDKKPILSDDECREFAGLAVKQGSVKMNPKQVGEKDIYELYVKIFGGAQ